MAGGKETPRQKMIGMMYLVLTALLALNVSKQILDAFVAIEANIQRGTVTQLERGNAAKSDLTQEISQATNDEAGRAKVAKIKLYLAIIQQIDKEAADVIKFIDDIKLDMLDKAKENITTVKENDEKVVVWKKYDKNNPLQPTTLNLMAVNAKDQFDIPMHEIVGSEISKLDPNKYGKKLWEKYNNFRARVVELAGSYKEGQTQYKVKTKPINKFKSNADLDQQVKAMITGGGNKVNKEDVEALMGIYQELTKQEFADHHEEKNIHWMGRTFDHAPLVGAIASLSSLQNEILSARAKAVNLLKSKVSVGQYSFNKIIGLAYPETSVLNPGDEFKVTVMMAAFDSDKQPVVKPGQGTISEIKDGQAILKMRAPNNGEMKITGEVGIADKSGTVKWMPYESKIQVATKAGAISLPEMAVMYTGWKNKVVPVVAGAVSTDINVQGGTKEKASWTDGDGNKFEGYYVNVTPGTRFVTVELLGKDKEGKSNNFGKFKYKVKPFPNAQVQGTTISKTSGFKAVVSLGADSPFTGVQFQVIGGEVIAGNETVGFTGDRVGADAIAKIKAGKKISVDVSYKRVGSNEVKVATATLKVVN